MTRSLARLALGAIALVVCSMPAAAHVGHGPTAGLGAGLSHPLGGLDHLLAMLAVGLWAGQHGGRARWLLPLAFVAVMLVGGMLGMAGLALPIVERGIALSVLVLGGLVATALRLPLVASAVLIGAFAFLHGQAHGAEAPETVSGLAFAAGFVLSTLVLHGAGLALSVVLADRAPRRGPSIVRTLGAIVAMAGMLLLAR